MLHRLSHSILVASDAAHSSMASFLRLCGRGLLRQTRFQATGFWLAVLGMTMYHATPCFAQSSTFTVTVTGGTNLGTVPIGEFSYFGTVNASASPDPGGVNWTWSGPTGGGSGMGYVTPSSPSSTGYVAIWPFSAGSQTYTFSASGSTPAGSSGSGASGGPGSTDFTVTVVEVESITLKPGTKHYVGKTLVDSDFIIETNPPGNESMVTITNTTPWPGGGALVLGANTFLAKCGTSSEPCTVEGVAIQVTADISSGSLSLSSDGMTLTAGINFQAGVTGDDGTYSFSGSGDFTATGTSPGSITDGSTISLPVVMTISGDSGYSGGSGGLAQQDSSIPFGLAAISDSQPAMPEILADFGLTFCVITLVVVCVAVSGCSSGTVAPAPGTTPPTITHNNCNAAKQLALTNLAGTDTSLSTVTPTTTGQTLFVAGTKIAPAPNVPIGTPARTVSGTQSMSVTMGAPAPATLPNLGGAAVTIKTQTKFGPIAPGGYAAGATTATWPGPAPCLSITCNVGMQFGVTAQVSAGSVVATW